METSGISLQERPPAYFIATTAPYRSVPAITIHSPFFPTPKGTLRLGESRRYLVGVGLLAAVNTAEWATRVCYQRVRTQEQAKVVDLGKGECRTDISFKLLPTPTTP